MKRELSPTCAPRSSRACRRSGRLHRSRRQRDSARLRRSRASDRAEPHLQKRDADLGSIERALRAHDSNDAGAVRGALAARRAEIDRSGRAARARRRIVHGARRGDRAGRSRARRRCAPRTRTPRSIRVVRSRPAARALARRRARGSAARQVAASSTRLPAGRVLTDDVAGSVRFPIHVRYGEREQAYCLDDDGAWHEIAFERARRRPPPKPPCCCSCRGSLPRELVLVHAPAFDSGDPDAEDVNVAVASHASEVLCLFSRQLSDRELEPLRARRRVRPADALRAYDRRQRSAARNGATSSSSPAEYLKARAIPGRARLHGLGTRIRAGARARRARRPAGTKPKRSAATLEAHAEVHMARLDALGERTRDAAPAPADEAPEPATAHEGAPGFFARLLRQGAHEDVASTKRTRL